MRHGWNGLFRVGAVAALGALALTGCTGSDEGGEGATPSGGGSVGESVEPVVVPTLDPVPIEESADADGVEVSVEGIERVTVEAVSPGDVAGSAVVVEIAVSNGTQDAIDVGTAVVTLTRGDMSATPAISAAQHEPLTGTLDAGDSARGAYVFMLSEGDAGAVTLTVNAAVGVPVAIFTGDIPS